MDFDYEHCILKKDSANLLKIPPMKSVKGHYLKDWGKNIIWQGTVKVMAHGETIWLSFVDTKTGKEMASVKNLDKSM